MDKMGGVSLLRWFPLNITRNCIHVLIFYKVVTSFITVKTETSEELHEWRTALEHAFLQAPCPSPVNVKNGIMVDDVIAGAFCQCMSVSIIMLREHIWPTFVTDADFVFFLIRERQPLCQIWNSGKPNLACVSTSRWWPLIFGKSYFFPWGIWYVLFVQDSITNYFIRLMENVSSFFIFMVGIKIEGILRISADVEEVQRRIQEFDKGIMLLVSLYCICGYHL